MRKLIAIFGFMALLAQPLAGQSFTPQAAPTELPDEVNVTFTGTNGNVNGPYNGLLNYPLPLGSNPTTAAVTLYCVDNFHYVRNGDNWDAYRTSLEGTPDLSLTRGGNLWPDALDRYRGAAFLASLYSTTDMLNWYGHQTAIWTLMSPGYAGTSSGAAVLSRLAAAVAGSDAEWSPLWSTFNFAEWSVLSDKASFPPPGGIYDDALRTKQEYLVRHAVVPEPQTYVLLLSGLIAVFFVARRRMKENGYA